MPSWDLSGLFEKGWTGLETDVQAGHTLKVALTLYHVGSSPPSATVSWSFPSLSHARVTFLSHPQAQLVSLSPGQVVQVFPSSRVFVSTAHDDRGHHSLWYSAAGTPDAKRTLLFNVVGVTERPICENQDVVDGTGKTAVKLSLPACAGDSRTVQLVVTSLPVIGHLTAVSGDALEQHIATVPYPLAANVAALLLRVPLAAGAWDAHVGVSCQTVRWCYVRRGTAGSPVCRVSAGPVPATPRVQSHAKLCSWKSCSVQALERVADCQSTCQLSALQPASWTQHALQITGSDYRGHTHCSIGGLEYSADAN